MDRLVLGQGWSIEDYQRLRGRRRAASGPDAGAEPEAGVPTPRSGAAPPVRRGQVARGLVGRSAECCPEAARWHVTGAPWR
ncbi:hypothetical protein [Marinitenerispora sediminis]|uniref:Uncharacterized protein n=1 Tax=Marinitenerispora sediminis TaxID=1931232 RepID=A0A368TAZ5_9ACTN|nr:hypothetical protein [Marinitenerispora sediminis]RCV51127.1 hypothetical protein DEF28_16240 [Marinitenerispora sediminis]RCV58342.1 hypothetical protein DEF23_09135 [Marinitenerispora sediminis]RCV60146.1 hypothetical protein DEF24_07895 [Marinitenerispora sediminis]